MKKKVFLSIYVIFIFYSGINLYSNSNANAWHYFWYQVNSDYDTYYGYVSGEYKTRKSAEEKYTDNLSNKLIVSIYDLYLIQPNGNEHIENGTTYEVKWTQSGDMNDTGGNVIINLINLSGSEISTLYNGPNTGTFNWLVNSIPAGLYKMRINSQYFSDIIDESVDPFYIEPVGVGTPVINVLSPDSNSTWAPSSTNTITWTTNGTQDPNVKIELFKNSVPDSTISFSTENDGSFDWTIDADQAEGVYYQVRISTLDNQVKDESEFFSIATDPWITTTATLPTSTPEWVPNNTYSITWNKK